MNGAPVGPKVWLANCYFSQGSSRFFVLLRFSDAQSGRSFHPFRSGYYGLFRELPSSSLASLSKCEAAERCSCSHRFWTVRSVSYLCEIPTTTVCASSVCDAISRQLHILIEKRVFGATPNALW